MAVMTANKYVRPTNGNDTNDGNSWANAYKTLQKALDNIAAGQIINAAAEANEVLTVICDADTTNGTVASRIRVVGTNSSGELDGTRYVLDGNSAVVNCLKNVVDFYNFENIECKNATGDGFLNTTGSGNATFISCFSNNNGAAGFGGAGGPRGSNYIFCHALDNATHGFYDYYGRCCFCTAIGNGTTSVHHGFYNQYEYCDGCISHDNAGRGFYNVGRAVINSIADNNGAEGIYINSNFGSIIGCRITNNLVGIAGPATTSATSGGNVYYNNTTKSGGIILIEFSPSLDAASVAEVGYNGGAGGGATDDFNLKTDAIGRRASVIVGDYNVLP